MHNRLALNVFAAETEEEAQKLTAPFLLFEHRLKIKGDLTSLIEDEETAIQLMGELPKIEKLQTPQKPPKVIAGTPDQLKTVLTEIAETYGAEEIMIQSITANHEARLKSHQLLAEAFELNKTEAFELNKVGVE